MCTLGDVRDLSIVTPVLERQRRVLLLTSMLNCGNFVKNKADMQMQNVPSHISALFVAHGITAMFDPT